MATDDSNLDLFQKAEKIPATTFQPLAERMRPKTLDKFVGHADLVGEGKVLRRAIEMDRLISMIFWGPPAIGKTTLARIIANETASDFHSMSAVTAGVADIKKVIEKAKMNQKVGNRRTILFIDEIHRFNKAQQDALLHSVEDGTIILIGATTENPSFEVNSALLSRCQVFQLQSLNPNEVKILIQWALETDELIIKQKIFIPPDILDLMIQLSGGDVRITFNTLELAANICPVSDDGTRYLTRELIQNAVQKSFALYDKKGDMHYDTVSAFIKSIRGSDPDAAIHYLARMLEAGEDPKFIARRLVILASEDIGNAAPLALVVATSAFTAVTYVGMPEAQLILAQTVTYLASTEKSNASCLAILAAREDVRQGKIDPIPMHLRNAPTNLMKDLGYSAGYKYPHDYPDHFVPEEYLPPNLKNKVYYEPGENGFEKKIKEYLKKLWPARHK